MIAIAILGVGLLVVASMFPIAWGKARDLSQHTIAVTIAETAEMTVKMVTRVDSAQSCANFTSFAGDYVVETSSSYFNPGALPISASDTKVHPLTLENVRAIAPPDGSTPIVSEDAWLLTDDEKKGKDDDYYLELDPNLAMACQGHELLWYDQDHPQVRFHQRVYPAVDAYPADVTAPDPETEAWNARLATRRYCWAAFHRLTEAIADPSIMGGDLARFQAERLRAAQTPRAFTMYYVTLHRAPGQRFALQDEDALASNDIEALPADEDVKFPSPWLVPLKMPKPSGTGRSLNYRTGGAADVVPRGVPTDVLVEANDGTDDDFRDFFPPGTQFIDSVSGEVYRVVKRRFIEDPAFNDPRFDEDPDANQWVMLTLDREVFVEELVDPDIDVNTGNEIPGTTPVEERRVWVFPPATERGEDDELLVEGPAPVVAIDVRSLVIYPQ